MEVKIQEYTSVALILVICLSILCLNATNAEEHNIYNILLWTSRHTKPFDLFEEGQKSFTSKNCKFQNCNVTFGKSFEGDPRNYEAVLFNAVNLARKKIPANQILPRKRSEDQKYVLVSTESAANHPIHEEFNRVFNWTWTYKLDSDIVWPKIVIRKITNTQKSEIVGPRKCMSWGLQSNTSSEEVRKQLNKVAKNQIVASFLTKCNESQSNNEYMDKMNEALKKIENLALSLSKFESCSMKNDLPPQEMQKVHEGLVDCSHVENYTMNLEMCKALNKSNYFFHLIFENSFAEDYVSESLLTALSNFAVPIVLGGANYSRFMPEGAYINAKGVKPEQLVKKMIDILMNIQLYENMHSWRNYYTYHAPNESPETDPICQFCAHLNNRTEMKKQSMYTNTTSWFNVDNDFNDRIETNDGAVQIIDLYNFTFELNSDICQKKPPLSIVGVIPSKVTHFSRRRTIRETWGQSQNDLKVIFILGESKNKMIDNKIVEEHNRYGDIVQGNFIDTYRNLSYKHIMALKWVTQYCQVAKYILKADDDVFVHLKVVEKLINDHIRETDEIICHVIFGMKPVRDPISKHFVSRSEVSLPYYLPYCNGPFVIYNAKIVHLIVAAAETERYFHLEDIFVGKLIRKLNLPMTDISQLVGRQDPIILFQELMYLPLSILYIHDLEDKYIRRMWNLTEKLRQVLEKQRFEEDIGHFIIRYSPEQINEIVDKQRIKSKSETEYSD